MRQLTKSPCLDNVIRQVGGMAQQRRSRPAWPRSSHRSVHKSTPVTGRVTALTNGEDKWATLITRNDSGKRLNVTVREKKRHIQQSIISQQRKMEGIRSCVSYHMTQHSAHFWFTIQQWLCSLSLGPDGFLEHFLLWFWENKRLIHNSLPVCPVHWLKGPVWFFLDVHEPGAQRCSYVTWRLRRYSIHQCHLLSA